MRERAERKSIKEFSVMNSLHNTQNYSFASSYKHRFSGQTASGLTHHLVSGTTHSGFVSMKLVKAQSPLPDRTHPQPLDLNVLDHRPDREGGGSGQEQMFRSDTGLCAGARSRGRTPEPR